MLAGLSGSTVVNRIGARFHTLGQSMPGKAPTNQPTDDRGRPVILNAVTRGGDVAAREDPQLADLRMRAHVSAAPKRSVLRLAAFGAAFGLLAGSGAFLSRWLGASLPAWVVPGVMSAGMLGYFGYRNRRAVRRIAPAIIDTYLFEGRCPGCGYVLDGSQTESDDCRVCPECGAAWKAARVGTSGRTPEAIREYRRRLFNPSTRERWLPGVRMPMLTRDARDRAVSITNPRLRRLDQATADRIGPSRVEEIRRSIGWRHRGRGLLLTLCMLPGLALFVRMLFKPRPVGGTLITTFISMGTFLFCAAMALLLGGFVVSLLFGDNGLSAKRVIREFTGRGLCPQCLSNLDTASAEADGTATCATCDAAWRIGGSKGSAAG